MKKIFILLFLVGAILVGLKTQEVVAESRQGSTITGYTASTLIKRGDQKVYRITLLATSNGGNFTISDSLTIGATSDSNVKTEGSEATALNSKVYDFSNKPLEGSTGLYLTVTTANIVVEYE